ncbi:hypothetical protein G7Y89_g5559 [Cudoniella acicularis]|uniref:MARVEL domain-containing protein n=1 Tax=Cudoniella acicularis TaxID=354080 RepID=A0A8H4RPF4_9HELO|nr:hypothetical protein G7Y89_g5559 [Cudoniella acicularis]
MNPLGAVVINGVLYYPYSINPENPSFQVSQALQKEQQTSLSPVVSEPSQLPSAPVSPQATRSSLPATPKTLPTPQPTPKAVPRSIPQPKPQQTKVQPPQPVARRAPEPAKEAPSPLKTQLQPTAKPTLSRQPSTSALKMQGPNHGALGATFTVVRGMQIICLISIIGMTANFVSQMVQATQAPPQVIVGTLSVTCIAVLYVAITYILYFDGLLPFLVSCGFDTLLLIAVIVVATVVGKPLSYLDCPALPDSGTTYAFIDSVSENIDKVNYWVWAGASKTTCFEMKAIWGLSIALCVLFAFSAICSACLWKLTKAEAAAPPKDVEG